MESSNISYIVTGELTNGVKTLSPGEVNCRQFKMCQLNHISKNGNEKDSN